MSMDFVAWFETLGDAQVGRIGTTNASLGDTVRTLKGEGVPHTSWPPGRLAPWRS